MKESGREVHTAIEAAWNDAFTTARNASADLKNSDKARTNPGAVREAQTIIRAWTETPPGLRPAERTLRDWLRKYENVE